MVSLGGETKKSPWSSWLCAEDQWGKTKSALELLGSQKQCVTVQTTIKHNAAGYKSHWEGKHTDAHSGIIGINLGMTDYPSIQQTQIKCTVIVKKCLSQMFACLHLVNLSETHFPRVLCWNFVIIFNLLQYNAMHPRCRCSLSTLQ